MCLAVDADKVRKHPRRASTAAPLRCPASSAMSELLPPVRSDSASSGRRSDSRNSATVEEGGLFGASSSAAGLLESAGRDGGVCDDDDVSESPTMGEDFYKGVEGFLAKPAPTLRHFCKGPPPGGQSLPVLRKQRSDLRRGKVPGAAPAAKPQRRPRGGDDGDHVDVAKVAEALQFCEGLAARDLAGGGGGGDARAAPRRRSEAPREKQERRRDARRSKLAPARSSDDVSATYGVAPRGRRDRKPQTVPKPNLQPDFNMSVFECVDPRTFAALRELDESNR